MTIDLSPMSTFLTISLFLIGIPAAILSVVVWLKITRQFFNDRDYELEVLPDDSENTTQFPGKGEQATKQTSQSASKGQTLNERMIQSG